MRQQEQSEWAAANPLPQELSAGASKVEQMTAEHLRMVREIRRLTKDDRFTGSCCLELANRPMEVMDDLEEVLPSVTNDPWATCKPLSSTPASSPCRSPRSPLR